MREQNILKELFVVLKVRRSPNPFRRCTSFPSLCPAFPSHCYNLLFFFPFFLSSSPPLPPLQAPFKPSAGDECNGVLLDTVGDVLLPRNAWIKEICRLSYVLIRQLATDYRKNQVRRRYSLRFALGLAGSGLVGIRLSLRLPSILLARPCPSSRPLPCARPPPRNRFSHPPLPLISTGSHCQVLWLYAEPDWL